MSRLFISYSTKDGSAIGHALVAALEAAGQRCWIAPRNMKAGADYPSEIVRAIRECRGLVVLITPGANQSQDVLQEVQLAHNERKQIFPLIIHGTKPGDGLSYFLNIRQQIPWTEASPTAAALRRAMDPATMTYVAPGPQVSAGPLEDSASPPLSAVWNRLPPLGRLAAAALLALLVIAGARTILGSIGTALKRPAAVSSPAPHAAPAALQQPSSVADPQQPSANAAPPPASNSADAAARGDSYLHGSNGLKRSDTEAVHWYELAASQGNAHGEAGLGYMYQYGRGVPMDEKKAVHLYQLAADQHDLSGEAGLGIMYAYGWGGLQKDTGKAVTLIRHAAQQGNARAKASLGFSLVKTPEGVPEGLRLLQESSGKDDPWGQAALATVDLDGIEREGVPANEKEALRLANLSADQDNPFGFNVLALMFLRGKGGLPKDARKAESFFQRSAAQGDPDGQAYLGAMYAGVERGLPQNCPQALGLLHEGAARGGAFAAFVLGQMYRQGICTAKNDAQSLQWYTQAARNGRHEAQAYLRSRGKQW